MPSTRELRRRIRSVRSTRQITKAMELVSTAKMRRATEATLNSRPYAVRAWEVLQDLGSQTQDTVLHPLLEQRSIKNMLVFLIASDRGQAGAFNANVIKKGLQFAAQQQKAGRTVSFITMGKRGESGLVKAGVPILQSYPHLPMHPTSNDVLPISTFLTRAFLSGEFDHVSVVYTHFHSMLRQEVKLSQVLPLNAAMIQEEARQDAELMKSEESVHKAGARYFIYEPNPQAVLDYVLPRLVEVQLYQSLQESLASEHSARRMAMKSATDNASEMIDDLTLTYNSVRQSNITREIAEITGGAAALEN